MIIETFDEGGRIELTRERETKWNPPLVQLRCLGANYLNVPQAIKLRNYLDKYINKHQKRK